MRIEPPLILNFLHATGEIDTTRLNSCNGGPYHNRKTEDRG